MFRDKARTGLKYEAEEEGRDIVLVNAGRRTQQMLIRRRVGWVKKR